MKTKQLILIGGAVAGVAKFHGQLSWKTAAILGAVAVVAAGLADNVLPEA